MKAAAKVRANVYNYQNNSTRAAVGKTETQSKAIPVKWGEKDDLPHHYLSLVDGSGTATACLQRLSAFIFADGFADAAAGKFKVNETQTADALLYELKNEVAYLEAIPLRIRYTFDRKKTAEVLPAECIRKLSDGTFIYNPTLGAKKVDKLKEEILQPYDPSLEAVNAILSNAVEMDSQPGQLYFLFPKRKGAYDYPKPPYATTSGLADIETDKEISLSDLDDIKNGFMVDAILTLLGEVEPGSEEEDDLQNELKKFTERKPGQSKKRLMVLSAASQELIPDLKSFDNASAFKAIDALNERVTRKVCRHIGMHPALVGIAAAGQLGQTQEIINAIQLIKLNVLEYQGLIQRAMEELFPVEDSGVDNWVITSLNPLNYIQPEVLAKMTEDEIRALGGLTPIEKQQSSEAEKILNALNTLSPLVANKVLESMSAAEIRSIIGLPDTFTPPTEKP